MSIERVGVDLVTGSELCLVRGVTCLLNYADRLEDTCSKCYLRRGVSGKGTECGIAHKCLEQVGVFGYFVLAPAPAKEPTKEAAPSRIELVGRLLDTGDALYVVRRQICVAKYNTNTYLSPCRFCMFGPKAGISGSGCGMVEECKKALAPGDYFAPVPPGERAFLGPAGEGVVCAPESAMSRQPSLPDELL